MCVGCVCVYPIFFIHLSIGRHLVPFFHAPVIISMSSVEKKNVHSGFSVHCLIELFDFLVLSCNELFVYFGYQPLVGHIVFSPILRAVILFCRRFSLLCKAF